MDLPAQNPEDVHALLAAAFNSGDIDAFVEVHEENATVSLHIPVRIR